MKSFQTLYSLFESLSQNNNPANVTLGKQLINDQARYLTQKYFDNLQTSSTSTVGGMNLTLTAPVSIGATSATLSATWTYPTVQQLVNFSNGQGQIALFTNGSSSITWPVGLTTTATASISTVGAQAYTIPANISKIKDVTIYVGQLQFVPTPILTDVDWRRLNFLPYASDIPNYFYVFGNTINIFPIPSTTGNTLTYSYKRNVSDMTYDDYSTGTVAATVGTTTLTGTATAWTTNFPSGTDLTYANLFINISPNKGDGQFYQIANFVDDTHLTLIEPIVNAPVTSGASYTIGQYPLLQGDFHDMIVYGALKIYFSSIVNSEGKFKLFSTLYNERMVLMESYLGNTTVNVDLGGPISNTNPNLFLYSGSSSV